VVAPAGITGWRRLEGGEVAVRAIRGATRVDRDEKEQILEATRELLRRLLADNDLSTDDVISILFTATGDLSSQAPAMAARQLGLTGVALLCAQEMEVPGSMPRVIRLMAHVETDRTRPELCHVYLRGTEVLRGLPLEDPG
jgi:chorismate mutase